MNEQDIAAKTKPTELFECFDPGTDKQRSQYDLFQDMNILLRNNDDEELLQNHPHDSDYQQLVRSVDKRQREFFYYIYTLLKLMMTHSDYS